MSADNPGAGVNKPYVEPALAGDNKAFDFSRELFTSNAEQGGLPECSTCARKGLIRVDSYTEKGSGSVRGSLVYLKDQQKSMRKD